jgi:flagellar basal-body rod protein FlgF
MDRLLYVSAVGLGNIEQAQTARANNLANVSTNGFRADLAHVMASEVDGQGYRARVYGVNEAQGVDLSHGPSIETGRDLDVSINGDGLFAVVGPDGTEGYTRNGAFQVDAAGRLLTQQGHPVLGAGGPIALPPFETIVFGRDGTITVRPQGQGPDALVQVDQLKLVNEAPVNLRKNGAGLLVTQDELPLNGDPEVSVTSGFLEGSNVNAINELTEILALARQFELEVRMMKVAEENDSAAAQLLRIG